MKPPKTNPIILVVHLAANLFIGRPVPYHYQGAAKHIYLHMGGGDSDAWKINSNF